MIDNQARTMALIKKMEEQLPIPARPSKEFIQDMARNNTHIEPEVKIYSVLYMGDEGGIACTISEPKTSKQPIVVSITHLRVPLSHPLAKEILRYQKHRVKKLKRGFLV